MSKLKLILLLLTPLVLQQGCTTNAAPDATVGVSSAYDRRTTSMTIDDQGIEYKAARALYDNKNIYEQSHINVISYNGIVLITGETPTEELKQEISSTVKAIPNVRAVHNKLLIAAPSALTSRSSDAWITSKIKTKLATDKQIEPYYINVVTENGVVYLMGIVSHSEADNAVSVVTSSAGVQRVVKIFQYTD